MTWDRLILLFLVASLALPATLLAAPTAAPVGVPSGPPLIVSGEPGAPSPVQQAAARKKARDTKQKRRADRRKAKQQRRQKARSQDTGAIATQRASTCEAAGLQYLPQSQTCTHGGDPVPPGVSPTGRAAPIRTNQARPLPRAACVGDGVSGPRVQVLYVRATNLSSKFATYRTSFQTWAADASTSFANAADETGGSRSVRFVTTAGCEIDVQEVTVGPNDDNNVDALFAAIRAQGFKQSNRRYLAFVDTTMAGACGHGSLMPDDVPAQNNYNNYWPAIASVYANCWNDQSTTVHELLHTFGAVQNSAPNASGYGHCIDEYDVMCYVDGPGVHLRYDCPSPALDTTMIDCGKNDYFHTNPPAGNYLATHWNAADSRFLIGGGNGPDEDGLPPNLRWVSPGGNDSSTTVFSGTVTLTVNATDSTGIRQVELLQWNKATEKYERLLLLDTAPWTTTVNVSDLDMGVNVFYAWASDVTWTWSGAPIRITRIDANSARPVITKPGNRARVKSKSRVQLSAHSSASTPVTFRYCLAASCTWERGTPTGNQWRAPKKGKATFLARAGDGPVSDPVTVTIQKAKKKKKKH